MFVKTKKCNINIALQVVSSLTMAIFSSLAAGTLCGLEITGTIYSASWQSSYYYHDWRYV